MKKATLNQIAALVLFVAASFAAMAAPFSNVPVTLVQPNGDTLHCFASGDEFYHRLHDAQGYTIVQNETTGCYVYAQLDAQGDLVPSTAVAGTVSPESLGLSPNLRPSASQYSELQSRWAIPAEYQRQHEAQVQANRAKNGTKDYELNHGTLNNLVILIRFADDSEITRPYSEIDDMFNGSAINSTSMYNYFRQASYGALEIPSHIYPHPNGDHVVSYQDSEPKAFFQPYNPSTNPIGYHDNQRALREFDLLERAVRYINQNCPVPDSINLDYDNDGFVDNVVFIVKGETGEWNDLLWPHAWSLYDRTVRINGKQVYTFNLQLEGGGPYYFNSSALCHEMFHCLGAPDLYHYYVGTDISPVGNWDIMCSNARPPQHMSAYMKYSYGNWLDSIPLIAQPGRYTLRSLATSKSCYRIQSRVPDQYFVLEFRNNDDHFESALPGSGLLVYRVDTRFRGNASFDGYETFDELYLFRPDVFNYSQNGNTTQSYLDDRVGRGTFARDEDTRPWLTNGVVDTAVRLSNIHVWGDSLTFVFSDYKRYSLRVSSSDLRYGTVSGSGTYLSGTEVTISAQPSPNSTFLCWNDGSTLNPRPVTLQADTLFMAIFQHNAGIDDAAAAQPQITVTGLDVTVAPCPQPVVLTDLLGRRIPVQQPVPGATASFRLPRQGVYLLKLGDAPARKIVAW